MYKQENKGLEGLSSKIEGEIEGFNPDTSDSDSGTFSRSDTKSEQSKYTDPHFMKEWFRVYLTNQSQTWSSEINDMCSGAAQSHNESDVYKAQLQGLRNLATDLRKRTAEFSKISLPSPEVQFKKSVERLVSYNPSWAKLFSNDRINKLLKADFISLKRVLDNTSMVMAPSLEANGLFKPALISTAYELSKKEAGEKRLEIKFSEELASLLIASYEEAISDRHKRVFINGENAYCTRQANYLEMGNNCFVELCKDNLLNKEEMQDHFEKSFLFFYNSSEFLAVKQDSPLLEKFKRLREPFITDLSDIEKQLSQLDSHNEQPIFDEDSEKTSLSAVAKKTHDFILLPKLKNDSHPIIKKMQEIMFEFLVPKHEKMTSDGKLIPIFNHGYQIELSTYMRKCLSMPPRYTRFSVLSPSEDNYKAFDKFISLVCELPPSCMWQTWR